LKKLLNYWTRAVNYEIIRVFKAVKGPEECLMIKFAKFLHKNCKLENNKKSSSKVA
jgi:hypothetical protein